jgi:hypothetical protein
LLYRRCLAERKVLTTAVGEIAREISRKQPEIANRAMNVVSKKGVSGEIPQEVTFMPIQKIILLTSLHAAGMAFQSLNNSEECHSISKTLHFHPRRWTNSR